MGEHLVQSLTPKRCSSPTPLCLGLSSPARLHLYCGPRATDSGCQSMEGSQVSPSLWQVNWCSEELQSCGKGEAGRCLWLSVFSWRISVMAFGDSTKRISNAELSTKGREFYGLEDRQGGSGLGSTLWWVSGVCRAPPTSHTIFAEGSGPVRSPAAGLVGALLPHTALRAGLGLRSSSPAQAWRGGHQSYVVLTPGFWSWLGHQLNV